MVFLTYGCTIKWRMGYAIHNEQVRAIIIMPPLPMRLGKGYSPTARKHEKNEWPIVSRA